MSDNLAIRIYVNKMESKRITFRIKKGYYLELLTPEAMKLLRNPNHRELKMKMIKMCIILEIPEVVLVCCNIFNKFTYFPLRKTFEKRIKTTENQGEK